LVALVLDVGLGSFDPIMEFIQEVGLGGAELGEHEG